MTASYTTLRESVMQLDTQSIGTFGILDVAFGLGVAQQMRHGGSLRVPWAQALVAYLMTCLGGTTITCILLGQPPDWMLVDAVLPTYIALFVAHRWCPGDLLFRVLDIDGVRLLVSVFDNVCWAASITQWGIFKALNAQHHSARSSATMAILCGIFSGCGGGIVNSLLSLNDVQWQFRVPSHISGAQPSYPLLIATSMAVLFYFLNDPHRWLPSSPHLSWNDARLVIAVLIVGIDTGMQLIAMGGRRRRPVNKKQKAN
jgi:hypothetical protein